MQTRLLKTALVLATLVFLVAGAIPAAEAQQQPGLPGSSADALKPPLQENQAEDSPQIAAAASGPSTPILDDFNRPNEAPLSQNGAWSPLDPISGGDTFSVISNQAGVDSNNNVSYRFQSYPGDVEVYASIPVKPANGGAVGLVFDIREEGGYAWDSYWLTWDALVGTDTLRVEIEENNGVQNLVTTQVEMSSGDRFMARRVGTQIEGWVFQGGSWEKKLEGTHPNLVGGKVGLFGRGTALRVDDFGGGSYAPPPPAVIPDPSVLDNFNRSNENPVSQAGNWASTGIGGQAAARLSGQRLFNFARPGRSYRTATFIGASEASVKIAGVPSSGDWLAVYVNLQQPGTAAWDGYELRATSASGVWLWEVSRVDNGARSPLSSTSFPIFAGTMLLRRHSSTLEFWWKPNGGSWSRELTVTDVAYSNGTIGTGGWKSGALDDFGGGSATDAVLLGQYVPEFVYDSQETYRADSAAEITDNDPPFSPDSNVLQDGGGSVIAAADPFLGPNPLSLDFLGDPYASGQDADEFHKIDEVNSYAVDFQRLHALTKYRDQVYGRVHAYPDGEKILQYWFFYYYNPKTYFTRGVHEGDWEMAQILLTAAGTPTDVAYAQHQDGEVCDWSFVIQNALGHPRVFVGLDSHASYFAPLLLENRHGDTTNASGETLVPSVTNVTAEPNWMRWPGRWGGTPDEFLGAGSPTGPKFKGEQWDDPRAWGRNQDEVDACTVTGSYARRIGREESAVRPEPPDVTAYRQGGQVITKYTVSATAAQAPKWTLLTTVDASGDRYVPLTKRTRLKRPSGQVVQPLGLGKAPFTLHASVIDHKGARSKVVTVRIRLRR